MADLDIRPWEPEEAIGTLWHRFVTKLDERPSFPDAAAGLDGMRSRAGILFRGLGGNGATDLRAAVPERTRHRRSLAGKIGHSGEAVVRTSFDGETLRLPETVDLFPDPRLNEALYLWLAAWAAHDNDVFPFETDPLAADLAALARIRTMERRLLDRCPGLRALRQRLGAAILSVRRDRQLPKAEAAVEAVVRSLLAGEDTPLAAHGPAPSGYRPFEPVPIWPDRRPAPDLSDRPHRDPEAASGTGASEPGRKRAKRHKSEQANRRDSLILHRFETILSFADFLNLNRKVEDDDEGSARKAADDADEMGLTDIDQRPATRLSFDLDLAPQDIDRERLSGESLYPEWDCRSGAYLADHVRVLDAIGEEREDAQPVLANAATRRRVRAVKRQFEALRPRRTILPRQIDGDDIDMDALVRSVIDLRVAGEGSDRVFRRMRNTERDLAVATLIDVSRSTESVVGERAVIDVAREALVALGHGLAATGDAHAIAAFSSLRRDRVFLTHLKDFNEAMNETVEARIAALRPGFYTRLGAAIRAMTKVLDRHCATRKLLLVITDGKPNDLDHYEGRYGIEDTRMAVVEARRLGHAVFGVAIDRKAEDYIPRIFGNNGHAIVSRPDRLAAALPLIYRHLVT